MEREPVLPVADAGFARRRRAGRRSRRLLIAGLPLLGAVSLLDGLPALFLVVVAAQVLFLLLARARRRRAAAEATAVRVEPTAAARIWFPVAWALLLAAIFVGTPPLRLVLCVLLAASLAAWPLTRAQVERVRWVRSLPARARVGAPLRFDVALENPTGRPVAPFLVRESLGADAKPAALEFLVEGIPARGAATAHATVLFHRRGLRRLRPARVSTRAPMGLFEASFEAEAPAEILVRPREGRATSALLARLTGRAEVAARAVAARIGAEEFEGLRDFRDGDDARRIHWRTTARRGTRTYVERRDEGTRRIVVVLGRGAHRDRAADAAFERAVSVAATLLRAAARAGVPASLLLGREGEPPRRVRGPRGLEGALDALAQVRADGGRRPLAALERLPRGEATTVVFVDPGPGGDAVRRAVAGAAADAREILVLAATGPTIRRWVEGLP